MKLLALLCLAVAIAVADAAATHSKAAVGFKDRPGSSISCEACKLIGAQFVGWLSANSTSQEVLVDLLKVCKDLPSGIYNTCSKLANDIAIALPKISEALKFADYTPEALCGMMGYCNIPCCVSSKPEQIHLALTENPTEMVVGWITANNDSTIVNYGTSPSSLPNVASAVVSTYSAGGWLGFIHFATLTGLQPSTTYYYSVGSAISGYTEVFHFETRDPSPSPIDWVVIGDMGADPEAINTIARLAALATPQPVVGGILHIGDIGYQDGVQHRWDLYMRMIQPFSGYLPYMTIPGNHEIAVQHYLHLEGYKYRFKMPTPPHNTSDFSQGDFFWSMDIGYVHFIGLDTEHPADIPYVSPAQLAWLEQDLARANANRAHVPWIVVSGHRPLWCSSARRDCEGFAAEMRLLLENIYYKYKVDLVFSGHCHNYERTFPVYQGKFVTNYNNAPAPVYIVNGVGGNREGTYGFAPVQPNWSVKRISQWGYGRLVAKDAHTLQWSFFTSADNQMQDTFTLTK